MKKTVLTIILVILLSLPKMSAQQAYFVDGYHGGIYGHYPMWVTQFMVDKLSQHPEWRIGIEIEPETWDTVMVKEPVAYANFKKIVADKRIEFTNPSYAQPYCYNISGESIIRQFEYGIKRIHTHFPDVTFTTYSAEEPCFTSSLPMILKQFGFNYAVLKCPDTCWGGYTQAYGGELVNWIGPDGTSILTVPRYECEELEDNSTWQTKAWSNSDSYLKACFDYGLKNPVGMCYQDAGWKNGPWIGHGNNIKNNSIYVTWKEYIENISSGMTNDNWHFSQEDVLVNLMWGSQVLQRIAQEVRMSENKIIMAEKMSAMANIENQYIPSQEALDEAWRTLMMAQHHDSWIVPYNGLRKGKTWAQAISEWTDYTNAVSDDIIKASTQSFLSKKKSKNLGYVRVYNTVGVKRADVVSIELPENLSNKEIIIYNSENKLVPSLIEKNDSACRLVFKPEVSSFGYSTYELRENKQNKKTYSSVNFDSEGDCIIENDMYKIILDKSKGGTVKSLIAKHANNKEFVDTNNEYSLGELSGHFYDENRFYSSKNSEAKISILEDNQFLIKVKVEGEIASHPYTQIITLASGQKRIDFDLTINWKENVGIGEYKQEGKDWRASRRAFTDDRYKLNVMFPVDISSAKLYKNAPFDVCESKLNNTFFSDWNSIKHNIILNWVDLSQEDNKYGMALLSDHTTSYSYGEDFPLSLTAQYSGVGLWGMNYKISQPLKIKYALVPHAGKWDQATISTESNLWNEPLIASLHSEFDLKDHTYVDANKSGFEISSMKIEGNDILIRLFNAEGDNSVQEITFDFPISRIDEILLNDEIVSNKKIEKKGNKSIVSMSIPRFGVKTLLIKK